jgi:hypothetical protein
MRLIRIAGRGGFSVILILPWGNRQSPPTGKFPGVYFIKTYGENVMTKYRLEYPLDDIDPLIMPGVDPEQACIYIFFIDGKGCYVGKSGGRHPSSRWKKAYSRNLQRMIEGRSYHIQGRDFRQVHYALYEAKKKCLRTALVILENQEGDVLKAREHELIHAIGTLNGPQRKKPSKKRTKTTGIIRKASKVSSVIYTVGKTAKVTKVVRAATGRSSNSAKSPAKPASWLDYRISAIKTVNNPFANNSKRWKRFDLLKKQKPRIVIREFRSLCHENGLNWPSNKYFWSAFDQHEGINLYNPRGRKLRREEVSQIIKPKTK